MPTFSTSGHLLWNRKYYPQNPAEPRRTFSNEFKLQMVKLASQPGASVARIAREHDINDNL
ncbi:TPA: transposase, partial [Escherichia coli]|nr:transposase [Escherichia coli]